MFNIEYWKYVDKEYPLSTIRSKKFTALTVKAIKDKPNIIVANVLKISKNNYNKFCFEACEYIVYK